MELSPARIRVLAALALQEMRVTHETALFERSLWFTGLGYSPAAMAASDPSLAREAALEKVRARILAAAHLAMWRPADVTD